MKIEQVVDGFILLGKLLQFVAVICINACAWMLKSFQWIYIDTYGMDVLDFVSS